MKNKFIKISIISILIVLIISFAFASYGFSAGDLTGSGASVGGANTQIKGVVNNIVKILTTVGSITSVVVLVVLGIKYMVGSIEEKSQYKKSLMPYVIGAIMVFGVSTITGIIYNVAQKLF